MKINTNRAEGRGAKTSFLFYFVLFYFFPFLFGYRVAPQLIVQSFVGFFMASLSHVVES